MADKSRADAGCSVARAAAAHNTANDLRQIQAYARRMSFIEDRRQKAYEFMQSQQAAAGARLDLAGILGAAKGYVRVLEATSCQFARVPFPQAADENAQQYLHVVDAEWKASVVSEEEKFRGIIHDTEAGIDDAQRRTDESNGHLAKAIVYVNKTYQNYGYQNSDVNDDMVLKKGAKPSVKTVRVQDGDCSA